MSLAGKGIKRVICPSASVTSICLKRSMKYKSYLNLTQTHLPSPFFKMPIECDHWLIGKYSRSSWPNSFFLILILTLDFSGLSSGWRAQNGFTCCTWLIVGTEVVVMPLRLPTGCLGLLHGPMAPNVPNTSTRLFTPSLHELTHDSRRCRHCADRQRRKRVT